MEMILCRANTLNRACWWSVAGTGTMPSMPFTVAAVASLRPRTQGTCPGAGRMTSPLRGSAGTLERLNVRSWAGTV